MRASTGYTWTLGLAAVRVLVARDAVASPFTQGDRMFAEVVLLDPCVHTAIIMASLALVAIAFGVWAIVIKMK